MTVLERLLAGIRVDDDDGCWIWTRATKDGYGYIYENGRMAFTHRVAYQLKYGPTDFGLDHLCRVTICCNPEHLEPTGQRENVLRGDASYERVSERARYCRKGQHLLTHPDQVNKQGRCRACLSDWRKEKYDRLCAAGVPPREAVRLR